MDLNLNDSDLFYDFVVPKLEPGLTPVSFDDSDLGSGGGADPNNNSMNGAGSHIKSFLDDMLFTDDSPLSINGNGLMGGPGSEFETITADDMSGASLGLLSNFQWPDGPSNGPTTTGSSPDTSWLSTPDGQVTTLTNILDPIFVTYDPDGVNQQDNKHQYFSTGESINNGTNLVSSDLISSTFMNEGGVGGSPDPGMIIGSDPDLSTTISWQKQASPDSHFMYCDSPLSDSSMLLRTALQGGKGQAMFHSPQSQQSVNPSGKSCDNSMVELRRVLSYPPMTNQEQSPSSAPSPTSTSSSPGSGHYILPNAPPQQHFYEFKILDPMFTSPTDDANIPNVEELIMSRIERNPNQNNSATFYNANQRKKMEISERKINSTTLSTKWTYAAPNNGGQAKPTKRRKKAAPPKAQQSNGSIVINSCDGSEGSVTTNSSSGSSNHSGSPNSSHGMGGAGPTSRKERSLHYCNICNKGFKDKYSVNVHIRVHSGEKPFPCEICGKHFRQKAHLFKHTQVHAAKASGQTGKGSVKRIAAM